LNVVYVYDNGNYLAAGQNGAANTQSLSTPSIYTSNDGSRMVKVISQDAFLYDAQDPPAFKPIYLGSGVKEAHFSNPKNGNALQIMLILTDGSFEMFDSEGNPINNGNN